ncbi:transport system permease protein [Paludibacter propionicigenes WB4]|uniref:Transport system permease protein n=1 Tax=Paludibacter propionicigenes (strain DSM 17365 / JCM 13257 / WB4) TaxID=694427 RepID=E4T1R8_PALPW|nr:iron ABC transporter permease [Paludibacter propionicigenes]ADQ78662.1 transport system permease protein [Paludibacter propionicigenes WB4]
MNPTAKLQSREGGRLTLIFVGLGVLLVVSVLLSACLGRYPLSVSDLLTYLFTGHSVDSSLPTVLLNVRLPRIIGALIVGAVLAIAGTAYQGLFRNPMVSPDILGVSSGAGFGASLAITLSLPLIGVQLMAFFFGLLAVLLALLVSRVIGKNHDKILMLVLSGMVTGAIFNALISLMKYIADSDSKLPDITFWLMGSLAGISFDEIKVVLPLVVAGIIPMLLLGWKLNVLSFGDEEAKALGVNTGRLRIIVICCASLITASVVCIAGLIGWIGLIVPHFARFLVGPNHKYLLPASCLSGSIFMLLVDDVARSATTLEIPLGILISLIGAPLFLVFLSRSTKKSW